MTITLEELKRTAAELAKCKAELAQALCDQFEYMDMPEFGIGRRPWKEAALAAREGIKMAEERRVLQIDELVEARKRTAKEIERTSDMAQQATAWEETCVSAKRQRDEYSERVKGLEATNSELCSELARKRSALKQMGIDAAELQARVAQLEGDCEELRTDLEHRGASILDLEAALEQERSQGTTDGLAGGAALAAAIAERDALKARNARLLIRAHEAEKLVRPAQNISGVPDRRKSSEWNSGYRQRQREEWSRALNSENRARDAEAKLAAVYAALEEGDDDGS